MLTSTRIAFDRQRVPARPAWNVIGTSLRSVFGAKRAIAWNAFPEPATPDEPERVDDLGRRVGSHLRKSCSLSRWSSSLGG